MRPLHPDESGRVYMAGPVQYAEDPGGWREKLPLTYEEFEWINPLNKYNTVENVHVECMEMEPAAREMAQCGDIEVVKAEEIVRSDIEMIEASDALLARLDGTATVGTPMEVRIAYAELDIPVVVWRTNNEPAAWSWSHSDAVRTTRGEAVAALRSLLVGGEPKHDPSGLREPGL